MAKKINTSPARGMRDLLPDEVALRDYITDVILGAYRRFGYSRIETPVMEQLALLTGSQGGDNEKLLFRILKRGEKLDLASAQTEDDVADFALRFDLTVPLARYYAEHQNELPAPFKAIQVGSVFRAERPQRGRLRQLTQCDIDVMGDASNAVEIELIEATMAALRELGLAGLTLRINHRKLLIAITRSFGLSEDEIPGALISIDKLDKIGVDGVIEEMRGWGAAEAALEKVGAFLRKLEGGSELAPSELAAEMGLAVENGTLQDFEEILEAVKGLLPSETQIVFDPTLVRGMGYYTGPIYEIGIDGEDFSIAGGGRYDEMVGKLIGREVPACGFSIGFERIFLVLTDRGFKPPTRDKKTAFLYDAKRDSVAAVTAAAASLRSQGGSVSLIAKRKKFTKQLEILSDQGYDQFVVYDPEKGPEIQPLESR